MIKILYEGETIFVKEEQLQGYEGCEVLGSAEPKEVDDCPYKLVGTPHLNSVHLQKAVEATLILSGYNLTAGLLAAEAEALGMTPEELATLVLAKRQEEHAYELERRIRKAGEGNSQG